MKCSGKGRNQIELPAKVRQRCKPRYLAGGAINSEKIDQAVEDRDALDVQAQAAMPQSLANEKKKPAPTTDIQNFLRRKPVQIQILGAPDILPKMFFHIEILRVMTPRAG